MTSTARTATRSEISWSESDGSDVANLRISTNRLELRLNSGVSAGAIRRSHGSLTLPVQLYAKIIVSTSAAIDSDIGLFESAGNFAGLRFRTQNTTQNIRINGSNVGSASYDLSSGTHYCGSITFQTAPTSR